MIGTATLRQLVSLGLTPAQILAVSEAMDEDEHRMDAPERSRKAKNQAAYRERQKQLNGNESDNALPVTVTGNAPPNDNISNPPVPSSNEDGAAEEIEISPETVFWNTGKAFLIRHGIPKTRASSALGKWKRDRGIAATVEALSAAETESRMSGGLVDPIGFIEGVFRNKDPTRARLGVPC